MSGALKAGAGIPGLAAALGPIAMARPIGSAAPAAIAAIIAMVGASLPTIPPPFSCVIGARRIQEISRSRDRACKRVSRAPRHLAPLAGRGRDPRGRARRPGEGERSLTKDLFVDTVGRPLT